MKVSVVIPTFNRAHLLRDALDSVLQQTFQDFEIVIVDDGSTDGTTELVQTISDTRIRYFTQDHRGVAAALNHGWQNARGTYIGRLDSDDCWSPTLLQELVNALEANPKIAVAYARAQGMNANGESLTQLIGAQEKFPSETLKSLVYGDFVSPMAVLIRRDALAQVGGYDESLIANEDWDLWLRLAQNFQFAYVPRVLARYRYHAQNLTRTDSAQMERVMRDRVRVLDKFFAQPIILPNILEIKTLAYRNVYMDWTIRYLERRAFKEAARTFQRTLSYAPSRIRFFPRALAVMVYYLGLSKTHWGVRLVDAWHARRRSIK